MAQFPFAAKKEAAPAAAVEGAPVAAEAVPAATKAPKVKGKKASGEDRKKPAAQMTPEQVKQILTLIKDHSYTETATMVGVTKFQVNRVLMNTKKSLREAAAGDPAKEAKVETYIKTYLSRPEDTLPGHGGARGGKVKGALDSEVNDILASLAG